MVQITHETGYNTLNLYHSIIRNNPRINPQKNLLFISFIFKEILNPWRTFKEKMEHIWSKSAIGKELCGSGKILPVILWREVIPCGFCKTLIAIKIKSINILFWFRKKKLQRKEVERCAVCKKKKALSLSLAPNHFFLVTGNRFQL